MGKILLLQAREAGDAMLDHELDCFVERTGIERERFRPLNMVAVDPDEWPVLDAFSAAMVGGSGDYSLVEGGFDWHEPAIEYTREIVDCALPFFGSCFGFQLLVQALGGSLIDDPNRAEVGTFEMTLTAEGARDEFFGNLPRTFVAQCGHNDSVSQLPYGLLHLASSERCSFQAVRLEGKSVWATQFHPELDMDANMTRYVRYLTNYADRPMNEDEAWLAAAELHEPSPHANALLSRFIHAVEPA